MWLNVGCMRLQGNITSSLECCDQKRSVCVSSVALLGEFVCVCVGGGEGG